MEFFLWPQGAPGFEESYEQMPPSLTPYLAENSRGAVIVCPGGGYRNLAAHEGADIAHRLNEEGISAFVLRYRIAPYHYPAPLWDVQRAVRTVRARAQEYALSPDKIAVMGFSAGGHLAGMAATMFDDPDAAGVAGDEIDAVSCRPDAAVLCYPVVSMCEACTHVGSREHLTGMENAPEDMRLRLSIERRVNDQTPPIFLWHTAEDASVPVQNALLLADALQREKNPFALHIYPHGRHGLGLAQGQPLAERWPDEAAAWLKSLGF